MRAASAFRVALVAMLTVGSLAFATPARACTSGQPTFDEVVAEARVIVDARVVAVREVLSAPNDYVLAVDRVLKGEAGDEIVLKGPRVGLCGDDITIERPGQRIIIAIGVRYFDQEISPYWAMSESGLWGWAGMPFGARSLDDVARSIAPAAAPEVVVEGGATSDPLPWLVIVVTLIAAFVAIIMVRAMRGLVRPDEPPR